MEFQLNTSDNEYAKEPKIKKDDIQQLMEWVQKQIHMPPIEEYMLIQFYFASNYSLQQTKNLLELHYTWRNEAPEFFTTLEEDKQTYKYCIWDIIYSFCVPQRTAEKYRVFYTAVKDLDASKYSFEKALAAMVKSLTATMFEDGLCPGYEIIFDLKGFSLGHFASVTITLIRKLVCFAQDLAPIVIKGIHIINGYKMIDKFMFIAERFIKKELFEIIHIHSNIDNFFKFVPKEHIPVDMGGTLEQTRDELNELMKTKVYLFEAAIDMEFSLKTDESKRTGEKKATSGNGTFRKLELD